MQLQDCISGIVFCVLFLQPTQSAPSPPKSEVIGALTASPASLLPPTTPPLQPPLPPPPAPPSPSPTFTSTSQSTNLTSTSPGGGASSNGRCATRATYPGWYASNWLIEDCYAAVQQLYMKETFLHPNQEYEFLERGYDRKEPQFPKQDTPRKYVVGSCTLTIMLLNWWGPGSLPPPMHGPLPVSHTDTSTYRKIWSKAKGLEVACPEGGGAGGWCVAGDKNAMGVFMWATGSDINSRVKAVPIVELPGANISTVGVDVGDIVRTS